MRDLFSLDGRVAFVTGGSLGLGNAMARGMAEYGAHVVINARNEERLNAKVEELRAEGFSAEALPFDVADFDACIAAIATIVAKHGHIDVLINNAGMSESVPLVDYSLELWQRHIDVHLTASFILAREAGRQMAAQGKGSIINISSVAGPDIAMPTIPAYTAAKAGLNGLTKSIAVELGPKNVRCNSIEPGYFETDLGGALSEGEAATEAQQIFVNDLVEHTPLRRMADARELAGLAIFLASDASSFVTGGVFIIDGGITVMQQPTDHIIDMLIQWGKERAEKEAT